MIEQDHYNEIGHDIYHQHASVRWLQALILNKLKTS